MAITKAHVESGDVISASLMNYILDQLEKIQGGTPADLDDIKRRLQALESWKTGIDSQVGKVNGIDARLSVAETSLNNLSGTAASITTLQQSLNALTTRVTTLESQIQAAGKVRINGFDPPEMIPVGQVLTILGSGFRPTLVENLVFINDTPIYNFRLDSDSSRLKLLVPLSIHGVTPTAGGTTVNIRVSNNDGDATLPFKVTIPLTTTGTAPKITNVFDINPNTGQITGSILHTGHTARVTGEGLAPDQNPAQGIARIIYKTPTGPASYPIQNFFGGSIAVDFNVPDIREAPLTGNFDAILEVARGNFVPALAQLTMTRVL
jgi:hypothetical protein